MKRKNEEALKVIRKFPIGRKVIVNKTMKRLKVKEHYEWQEESCAPFEAWIVGATWVCDGTIEKGESYTTFSFDEPPEYPPPYFFVLKKTPVLLVRKAMFSKEIKVPVLGVRMVDFITHKKAFFCESCPMTSVQITCSEEVRQFLREDAKTIPRDSKGRWLKR